MGSGCQDLSVLSVCVCGVHVYVCMCVITCTGVLYVQVCVVVAGSVCQSLQKGLLLETQASGMELHSRAATNDYLHC